MLATAAAVSQSFGRFTYSLLFTEIRDDFGISNSVGGALGSLSLLAYLLGSVLVSVTVVRVGMSLTAKLGLAGVLAALALLAWSPHVALLAVALVLAGVASAGVWVTVPGIATEVLGVAKRGVAAGCVTAGVGIGLVAASVIEAATEHGHWRLVYLVELVIGVVAMVWLVAVMRNAGLRTTVAIPAVVRSETLTGHTSRWHDSFNALASIPAWRSITLAYGLFASVISLVLTFTVARLTEDAKLGATIAAVSFSLIGVGSIIGGPLLGAISDRFGARRGSAVGLLIALGSTTAIATGNQASALTGAFFFGVAFTGVISAFITRISAHLDGDAFGAAYGLATIAFAAGLAIGPQVGGVAADWFDSFLPAFVLAIAVCAVCLVLTGTGDDPPKPRPPAPAVPPPVASPATPASHR